MSEEIQKIPIQLPRYLVRKSKSEAIAALCNHVKTHTDDFINGEEIVLRYYVGSGETKTIVSANAVIDDVNEGKISFDINESDTIKIVEQSEEPEDKDVIWLSDTNEEGSAESVETQLKSLEREVQRLKSIIEKHDYALSSTLAGGDIITNSEKYDREMEYTPEKPEDVSFEPVDYAEYDFEVQSFEIFIGAVPFRKYYESTKLYKGQSYNLKLKFYNAAGEEINPENISGMSYNLSTNNPEIGFFKEGTTILKAVKKGNISVLTTISLDDDRTLSRKDDLYFNLNEEPYYERYEEPNVHHLLIKTAETYDILSASTAYLCAPEFVWCVGNNTLYLRAKASTGALAMFKISGSGGAKTGDTDPTTAVTVSYNITDDGIVEMSGKTITIDDDGILSLDGVELDENGILNFIGASGGGGGGGDGGDEPSTEVTVEYDEATGYVLINAPNAMLDEQGILTIPEENVNN